jgi:glycosyltransferase involved in cell wall biosynthesis
MAKLVLIIPAFNEERALATTLANLPKTFSVDETEVVVVDDGSSDRTAEVALACCDPRVVLLRHTTNRGLGGALGTGLKYARLCSADFAITYDADGQHAPEDIEKALVPLVEGKADVVIGSRLLQPKGMPWYRLIGNWGLNVITYVLFGQWTTDSQSGLRAFGRRGIENIDIRTDRMEVSSEFFKEIRRLKLRFCEVPIRAIYTEYSLAKGQRNINAINILLRLLWHRLMEE